MVAFAALALHVFTVSSALACTVCDTDAGREVRAGILDADFGRTLLAVLLPFPILFGVVAAIHFSGPRVGRVRRERRQPDPAGGPSHER